MTNKTWVRMAILIVAVLNARGPQAQEKRVQTNLATTPWASLVAKARIVDVHLHAEKLDSYIAAQKDARWFPKELRRPASNEELMTASLAALRKLNAIDCSQL